MGANIFRGPVCRRARHHWRSIWRL
jgi:hypothetical protein